MMILRLTFASLRNRLLTTCLTVVAIGLGVTLLLGIEQIKTAARNSFYNTVSQADLIVGARGGSLQLLLYTLFHIGQPTNNITFESYQAIAQHPEVEWTIPISLGDSHKGFRVVATNPSLLEHYRFRGGQAITLNQGKWSSELLEVVIGKEPADQLGYQVGDKIIISHGLAQKEGILDHTDAPFTVVGILNKTFTPLDRCLFVSLESIEAVHMDWSQGGYQPITGKVSQLQKETIKVSQITAFLVRAKSRILTLQIQRAVNTFEGEPLMAIIPGLTLQELWRNIGYAEFGLKGVSWLVLVVSLMAMLISIYTSLSERRREIAILRVVGMGPKRIFGLLILESLILSGSGILMGASLTPFLIGLSRGPAEALLGFTLTYSGLGIQEIVYMSIALLAGGVLGMVPAIKAYRQSLSDGLSLRL
jgi:putative ABC transport system permease protein